LTVGKPVRLIRLLAFFLDGSVASKTEAKSRRPLRTSRTAPESTSGDSCSNHKMLSSSNS
jgi:hypothetical protein